MTTGTSEKQIGIIGGGIAGLTAAHNFEQAGYRKIRLHDENNYQGKRRSAWGEFVRNFEPLPLSKDCNGYRRHVEKGLFMSESGRTETKLADGAVIDRGIVEKELARGLDHAEVFEDERIDKQRFFEISEENDLVIDATGSFPISQNFVPV